MTGVSGRLVNYTEFSGIKIRSSEDEIIWPMGNVWTIYSINNLNTRRMIYV